MRRASRRRLIAGKPQNAQTEARNVRIPGCHSDDKLFQDAREHGKKGGRQLIGHKKQVQVNNQKTLNQEETGLKAESAATNRCEALKDKDRQLKMAILW